MGPFAGVDPYIEARGLWPDFHSTMTNCLREAIAARLPQAYDARIDQVVRLVEVTDLPGRDVRPDVAVLREPGGGREVEAGAGVMAVAVAAPPVTRRLPTEQVEAREAWVEIRTLPDFELVTVVELLSPTNKAGSGRGEYLLKRGRLVRQGVNLVEIDLLLGGHRLPVEDDLPPGQCFAVVARAERRPECDVYAWTVRDRLPVIPVPLRPPDADVPVDLAAVAATAYERGRYARAARYGVPLPEGSPLPPADRAWAEGRAREAAAGA